MEWYTRMGWRKVTLDELKSMSAANPKPPEASAYEKASARRKRQKKRKLAEKRKRRSK